jgi:hypothetical protein
MYLVVGPVVAIFLALLIGTPLGVMLHAAGLPDWVVPIPWLILLPIIFVWIQVWAYREYHQRAGFCIAYGGQGTLDLGPMGGVRFEDVAEVRLVPSGTETAVRLVLKEGKAVKLPVSVASLSGAGKMLEARLVRHLAEDLARRVEAGEAIHVAFSRSAALWCGVRGALQVLLGVGLVFWKFRLGRLNIEAGWRCARRGCFGVSGFEIRRDGLVSTGSHESNLIAWRRLTLIRDDDIGMTLACDDGHHYSASIFARNAWPVSFWLRGPRSPLRPDSKV